MWNPFKTLSASDHARLKALQEQVNDLSDDVEQCLNIIPKINARLRTRARRAIDSADTAAGGAGGFDDGSGDNGGDNVGTGTGPALVQQAEGAVRQYSKDELRGFARARGLMR